MDADHIPISFLGVKLEREAADVALCIRSPSFARYGRKAGKEWSRFSDRRNTDALENSLMSRITVKDP